MISTILVRNLLHKPLATLLSVVLLMLSVGIIGTLMLVQTQASQKFDNDLRDIDVVVGAKGSPLQLVLSAVYQIDAPTGNVKLADVEALRANPFVEQIVPLAFGDSYKTFRILGTDTAYVRQYDGRLAAGSLFSKPLEALLGSAVAAFNGLEPGDSLVSQHGTGKLGTEHAGHPYKVVGVLQPTGTVLDQLILTSVATVWAVHSNDDDHHNDDHRYDGEPVAEKKHVQHAQRKTAANLGGVPSPFMVVRKAGVPTSTAADADSVAHHDEEITAALLKMRSPMGTLMLPRFINDNTNLQAAVPSLEMNRLLSLLGIGVSTVQGIAAAIMVVSGFSVFVALYTRLRQRRYEHALMRSLGCGRHQLLWLTLGEGWVLALAGFLGGMALSRLGLLVINRVAASQFHFQFSLAPMPAELGLLALAMAVGTLAAVLPAFRAFSVNISRTLAEG
jgi:putative ABC transport system permease protein